MKDRIAHIMRAKNLKASDFAALLGIQPSGISHILSGRNQPSLDFVKKIKEYEENKHLPRNKLRGKLIGARGIGLRSA